MCYGRHMQQISVPIVFACKAGPRKSACGTLKETGQIKNLVAKHTETGSINDTVATNRLDML